MISGLAERFNVENDAVRKTESLFGFIQIIIGPGLKFSRINSRTLRLRTAGSVNFFGQNESQY